MFATQIIRGVAKMRLSLCVLAGAAGLAAQTASAAPIPNISTLQDLINAGHTGIIIGDKQFYDFSYIGSPTSGPNPAPTASQISVAGAPGSNIGLSFSYAWESAEGFNQDSVIRYSVHVLDSASQLFIDGVGLNFNGTAPVPGSLTNATVTETVSSLSGNVLGQLSTIDDGPGGNHDNDNAFLALNPATRDVTVTKDIQVHSTGVGNGGGVSTISVVDNTFHQVPEPASLGLLSLGAMGLLARRRA